MRRHYLTYFALAIFLFSLLNLPNNFTSWIRKSIYFYTDCFVANDKDIDLIQLYAENTSLKEQIKEIRSWLNSEDWIERYSNKLEEFIGKSAKDSFYKRRGEDLAILLRQRVNAVDAKVIFRDPSFWSSGIWINKGKKENLKLGFTVISKNSPVILGQSVVGVVEKVEDEKSYVRLITDSSLTPSVRVVRGNEQNSILIEQINLIEDQLKLREDLNCDPSTFIDMLESLKDCLREEDSTSYLAKGELCGSSAPLMRCLSNTLKGIGFNYEFSDRDGQSKNIHDKRGEQLIKVGDLLITSGLDGIFPTGLHIAYVSKIYPLKEGGYCYDLEAKSVIHNLNDLDIVQVCSPLTYIEQ